MPITVDIDVEAVSFTVRGVVSFDDVIGAINAAIGDARFRCGKPVLWDLREAQRLPDTDELRELARELGAMRERFSDRIGLVASSDFIYGISRMFSVFSEPHGVRVGVFRDLESARQWLGQSSK